MLFQPFRENADDPAVKRVEEILTILVTADRHMREHHDFYRLFDSTFGSPEFLSLFEKSRDAERAYYQTLEFLNLKLSRYRWEARLEEIGRAHV